MNPVRNQNNPVRKQDISNGVNYVIIGNSASGIASVEAIREYDRKGKITVISNEAQFNYSRPLISYLLGKKVPMERMPFQARDFYKDNKIDLILNKEATKLDLERKYVILADGGKIPFDKLLIATGGRPIVPEIKGMNLNGVFTFTNLDDAQRIERHIKANRVKRAVVLGGGLIGLKATEALIELKIKIAIVELADRILSATFDRKASRIIETALEKIDCRVIANNTIVEIKGRNNQVEEVILKDKKRIPAELVIIAIGVSPNVELAKNSSIKMNKGVLADNFMRTNILDVYAAGDCSEARDCLLGKNRPIAIWPAAKRQGKIAGFNMAGMKREYQGSFAMNSVELCGIPTISLGQTLSEGKDCRILEHFDKNKAIYKKIVLKKGMIIGIIFVNDIERAGIYAGLIKDKVDVSGFQENLLKEDFGFISLPKGYRKHLVTGEVSTL